MPTKPLSLLIRHFATLPLAGTLSDYQLLERFVSQRDEAAFEVLLWRHGPMVLNVSKRILRNSQDVEDAFQATFLILFRKAASIRNRAAVGSWLYKIALRVAQRARAAARPPEGGRIAVEELPDKPAIGSQLQELQQALDEEVGRLPENYRTAFVLCHLQGRTQEEAAQELGSRPGTIAWRLSQARQCLRDRLTRRGLTLGGAGLGALLNQSQAMAAVPRTLAVTTLRLLADTRPVGRAVTLAQGTVQVMLIAKLLQAAVLVLALGGLAVGVCLVQTEAGATPAPDDNPPAFAPTQARRIVRVASRHDGVIELVKVAIGQTVQEGDLLVRLDDRLARAELKMKAAKVSAAIADLATGVKTRDEAWMRYLAQVRTRASAREIRSATLTHDRYTAEVIAKEEAAKLAELESEQAQLIVEMHELRSPARGVIRTISKSGGEAVQGLETVMEIEILE